MLEVSKMTTKPPTEPGDYHWRAKEGDEWSIVEVYIRDGVSWVYEDPRPFYLHENEHCREVGGQWSKIPNPDECQEAWAVINRHGKIDVCWTCKTHTEAFVKDMNEITTSNAHTCKPVYIVPRESEVEARAKEEALKQGCSVYDTGMGALQEIKQEIEEGNR